MDCSMPGFPVHHQLPELAQTHVHWVGDAIQPSHPLLSPSSAFNLSQHQDLFQWIGSSHQVASIAKDYLFFFMQNLGIKATHASCSGSRGSKPLDLQESACLFCFRFYIMCIMCYCANWAFLSALFLVHSWFVCEALVSYLSSLGFPDCSAGKESACNAGDPSSIHESRRSLGEGNGYLLQYSWASLVAQLVKNPPAMWKTWVRSLGWEDPLEKGKATRSSILAWRIPWTV